MDDLVEIYCVLSDGTFSITSTLITDSINNEKIEAKARACLVRGQKHQNYHFIHSKDSITAQHLFIIEIHSKNDTEYNENDTNTTKSQKLCPTPINSEYFENIDWTEKSFGSIWNWREYKTN